MKEIGRVGGGLRTRRGKKEREDGETAGDIDDDTVKIKKEGEKKTTAIKLPGSHRG